MRADVPPANRPATTGGTGVPPATIRTEVALPLTLPDGGVTTTRVVTFDGLVDGREHLAIGMGPVETTTGPGAIPLVRLHSECLTGDVFGSRRCDCGPQLDEAKCRITAVGGWLLYLRQEGRGIGLYNKLDAYVLQDLGLDTYDANLALGHDADERDYAVAAQMLLALGVGELVLLGNNPEKRRQLEALGITVHDQVSTGVHLNDNNVRYLTAKATRGRHRLDLAVLRDR